MCAPVAHRQVVLTIPKRLRLHTRFDRKLLGKLRGCAWACLHAEVRRLLGRDDVVPGMVAAIQTHGELLHWAMLIKRVYEIDPLACPECGGVMKVVAFIEPPQGDVIEKILKHCGLWCPAAPRAPPAGDLHVHDPGGDSAASDESRELTYVDIDTFEATSKFFPAADRVEARETPPERIRAGSVQSADRRG